jgi:hypothetical protein
MVYGAVQQQGEGARHGMAWHSTAWGSLGWWGRHVHTAAQGGMWAQGMHTDHVPYSNITQ